MKEENKKTLVGIIVFAVVVIAVIIILLLRGCGTPEYKITFDTNGGSTVSEIVIKQNGTITKPTDPTKEGYKFAGWYYNDELFDFSTKVTKDMVLEARWEAEEIDEGKITLDVTTTSLKVNEKGVIEVMTLPEGVTEEDLVWTSSDESILTVDEKGNIVALKEGTVTVTVKTKDGKYTTTCEVTVTAVEVKGITISGASSVTVGSTVKLTVTPNQKVTWKSSNTSIATVDANGKVKGTKAGKVTITATTEDGTTATKTITVKAKQTTQPSTPTTPSEVSVTSVKINGSKKEIYVNETLQLTATVEPSDATNKKVTWKSSNPSVATVDANGKVTGVKAGKVTITVTTSNGKTATYEVTVKEKEPSYVIYLTQRKQEVTGGAMQYDFSVTKNGATFTDYLGFEYNGTKVAKNQGTVASTAVENGGSTAKLKLSDETIVTATVVVR